MDLVDNPYSPGAGLRPAVLAGRQDELDAFDALLRRGEVGRPSRGLILTGLRGVGKTVLLNELADRAAERDWIIAQLEVRPNGSQALLSMLAALVTTGIRRQQGPKLSDLARRALHSIKAFSLTVDPSGTLGASIDIDARGSGDLEIDFAALAVDVGKAALEFGTGVAVFIDELQELDRPTMASLAAAAHAAGQRNAPFVVLGAGLPNLPGKLAEAKSYAERLFDYRPLGKLSATTPARPWPSRPPTRASPGRRAAGRTWSPRPTATRTSCRSSAPRRWEHATGPAIITEYRRPKRRPARAGHPGQRLLPLTVGPRHGHRTVLSAGHGRRRRRPVANP